MSEVSEAYAKIADILKPFLMGDRYIVTKEIWKEVVRLYPGNSPYSSTASPFMAVYHPYDHLPVMIGKMEPWWDYIVIRDEKLPVSMNGKWFAVEKPSRWTHFPAPNGVTFEATHEWEQNDQGQVAVVYRRSKP